MKKIMEEQPRKRLIGRLSMPVVALLLNVSPVILMLLMSIHLISDNYIFMVISFVPALI